MCKIAVVKKFYVHEIATINLSKIYFLKNAKKTLKPNNNDLNRDWIIRMFSKSLRMSLFAEIYFVANT